MSLLAATAPAAAASEPTAGAPGVGDRLFPLLGNGGYDARHYTIELTVDVANNAVEATTTVVAQATQALSAFNLDFAGPPITRVEVDGAAARHERDGGGEERDGGREERES